VSPPLGICDYSLKSSRAISRVRCLYKTGVSMTYQIPYEGDRDGHRNIGFIRTPDAADSPRGFH
jgi:hypothetical protein